MKKMSELGFVGSVAALFFAGCAVAEQNVETSPLEVGFAVRSITPDRSLPIAGYFTLRPSTGVLDDIHARCLLFRKGKDVCGWVTLEVCMIHAPWMLRLREELKQRGFAAADRLIISATHSHTAPYTFGSATDQGYQAFLLRQTCEAVLAARDSLAPSEVRIGSVESNPLAFNRRYWMKDGTVKTNPGKLNPDIVKPEGVVDREIGVMSVLRGGKVVAIVANIVNHSDTVGEDKISADWAGRMDAAIASELPEKPFVLTLIGCAGNINHFDVSTDVKQTSYAEAVRIGKGYAKIVVDLLPQLKPLSVDAIRSVEDDFVIMPRKVGVAELEEAEKKLAAMPDGGAYYASHDLVKAGDSLQPFFVGQIVQFAKKYAHPRSFKIVGWHLGRDFATVSLPGEPFTEIGLAIKKASPFRKTWPVALAMGYCGYIPLKECFGRGGYETFIVTHGGCDPLTANRLVKADGKLLNLLKK